MGKRVVLAGGGHAHLYTLLHLEKIVRRGHTLTVVNPDRFVYYSGMGPGLLSGIYSPGETRYDVRKMTTDRGGSFLPDEVSRIRPQRRTLLLSSGREIIYDIVSFNVGSTLSLSMIHRGDGRVFLVKPVSELYRAREEILRVSGAHDQRFVVVGGGPAGVEVAGNLWRLVHGRFPAAEIVLVAGSRLLSEAPQEVRRLALDSLRGRGVTVLEGVRALSVEGESVHLSDGNILPFSFAFLATGIEPPRLFRESGLPVSDEGGLLVTETLQSPSFPEILGGGDCIAFSSRPLKRVGVYAVRQGPVLFRNILSLLEGRPPQRFVPQKDFLLILNMGNGTGIMWKGNRVHAGPLPLILKRFIDGRFMRKFQVSGEREPGSS